jgi:hypothetical protein
MMDSSKTNNFTDLKIKTVSVTTINEEIKENVILKKPQRQLIRH